jgi:hypothetical protein
MPGREATGGAQKPSTALERASRQRTLKYIIPEEGKERRCPCALQGAARPRAA